jgi:hypothetical protein
MVLVLVQKLHKTIELMALSLFEEDYLDDVHCNPFLFL